MIIFENESLEYLISLNEHCIKKGYENYLGYKETEIIPEHKDYKISIIIPNYNNAKWLDKCLGSIQKQTYKNYEIIFVDDLSTDNSIEIAQKYNCKIIKLRTKRYAGGARNEGLSYATGDYIYYIDSDDWLKNDKALEKINDNLYGQDILFVGLETNYSSYYIPYYKSRYDAIKGWSGSTGKVINRKLQVTFNEGTLKEDRTHHYKVCILMNSWSSLKEVVYVYNRDNATSVTTIRDNKWKIDTIRNWADSIEVYENFKGKDIKLDQILQNRILECEMEVKNGRDSQR